MESVRPVFNRILRYKTIAILNWERFWESLGSGCCHKHPMLTLHSPFFSTINFRVLPRSRDDIFFRRLNYIK